MTIRAAHRRGHRVRMEGREAGSYLLVGLILSSIYVSTQAQSILGFVSIDCGAASPYTDSITTFPWEADSPYALTGLNGQVAFSGSSSLDNADALGTFRYFPDARSKHCYELPTTANVSFLLRAMFYQGNAVELSLPIEFDVAVNGTIWNTASFNTTDDTLTTPVVHEGIFFSPGSVVHFCLVTGTGVPFISSLELRQLDPDGKMYSVGGRGGVEGQYLTNLNRVNCGAQIGSASVRYPNDTYDRLWYSPGEWSRGLPDGSGVAKNTTDSVVNNVPLAVLQDAWLNNTVNSSFEFNIPNFSKSIYNLYIVAYFVEFESDAISWLRINLSGVAVNIKATSTVWMETNFRHSGQEVGEFTFTGLPNSLLGPIVNAIEVYANPSFNDSATAEEDVHTLATLKESFNLIDWQGDPCYPVPWNWVGCTSDTPARVNQLLLSSMGIYASIPPNISNLDALTEIHLDNNSLYGPIPDSLESLPTLAFLYLEDNNLSGQIPPALITKLGSNFDYSGNTLLGTSSSPNLTTKKSTNMGVIIGAAIGGVCALGIVAGILLWYFCFKKKTLSHLNNGEIALPEKQPPSQPQSSDVETSESQPPIVLQSTGVGRVSYETVKVATNNFSVKIGEGSYGSVFHGWLGSREVAVKQNNILSNQGRNEFITEVDILTRVHHRNLVSLIAYCDEGEELVLVYEYQANGTLGEWLCDESRTRGTLDWNQRLKIAADAARGLEYLHKGCDPAIIHRDVKSSNILLDESMTAKVADFGLSKSTPYESKGGYSGRYSTGVKGTPGYLDPEYHQLGWLTRKSDVYSFGVVLAQIITGLLPYNINSSGKSSVLVERVQQLMERNDIQALADPNLQGAYNPESMWRLADVALSCIDPVGARRPDFTQVVNSISEAIQLEKSFTVHSPFVPPSRSGFLAMSTNSQGYQNLF